MADLQEVLKSHSVAIRDVDREIDAKRIVRDELYRFLLNELYAKSGDVRHEVLAYLVRRHWDNQGFERTEFPGLVLTYLAMEGIPADGYKDVFHSSQFRGFVGSAIIDPMLTEGLLEERGETVYQKKLYVTEKGKEHVVERSPAKAYLSLR